MRLELTGFRVGLLSVVGFSHIGYRGRTYWLCRCDCGGEVAVQGSFLISKKKPTRSCGCLLHRRQNRVDKTGKRYGRLVVIDREGSVGIGKKTKATWKCLCDCGNICIVQTGSFYSNNLSCGCLRRENASKIHRAWMKKAKKLRLEEGREYSRSAKYGRDRQRNNVEKLSDSYVKERLRDTLPTYEITPEMIEIKREQLQLTRLIRKGKELTNGITGNGDQRIAANA